MDGFLGVLQTILNIIEALLVLVVMVVIHELGHYSVGKLFKFKINEFAIGFGKPIYKKVMKSGEIFSIRPLPLGGYCAFEGEDEDNDNPRAFNNQKPWKRLLVLFAGAFFNFISAILIIALTFTFYGDILPCATVRTEYAPNSPFENGDCIMSIDDVNFSFFSTDFSTNWGEGTHTAVVRRKGEDGKRYEKTVQFEGSEFGFIEESSLELYAYYKYKNGETALGFENFEFDTNAFDSVTDAELLQNYEAVQGIIDGGNCVQYRFYRVKLEFFPALARGLVSVFRMVALILTVFIGLFTGGTAISDMGGPVTVISMLGQSASIGIGTLMYFVCLISANLAVFNLLPIPSLDGSRMVFVAVEWIRGKPVNRNIEGLVHFVGLIIIVLFAIMVDVLKLFR